MLSIQNKIKACCDIAGISLTELANRMGTSQQNLSKRLQRGKFTQDELEMIAKCLGCEYISEFRFPNGEKV